MTKISDSFTRLGTTLVLGGVRSGKSAYAEKLLSSVSEKLYIATAEPFDDEMKKRIARHKARRGFDWETYHAPLELPKAIQTASKPFLVDCLSVWLSNLMHHEQFRIEDRLSQLCAALKATDVPGICVSTEAGLGLLPENRSGRLFLDMLGELNQRVALQAEQVVLVAAGLPLPLK